MNVVLIDDEKNAIISLEIALKEYCTNVIVVGKATSAKKGIIEIEEKKPDLVFLDIQMPHMTGIELLETFDKRTFEVIFTTAFNNYAIKAFKLSAVDYLLKPIDIQELIDAVNRTSEKIKLQQSQENKLHKLKAAFDGKIAIPSSSGTDYLKVKEIIRIEADGSYSKIITTDGKTKLASKNLKELQSILIEESFFRTHKSHLINLQYVKKYTSLKDGGTLEMIDNSLVEVSRNHKIDLARLLHKYMK